MILIYGRKQTTIGFSEILLKCPACEVHTNTEIMVISCYFHLFWIPIFPVSREAHIVCSKCNMRRYNVAFDKDLFPNYEELKHQFRHPLFTYTGLALIIIFIVAILIAAGQ